MAASVLTSLVDLNAEIAAARVAVSLLKWR